MKLKAVLVEDELMARKSLEKLCNKSGILDLVQSCENCEEALRVLTNQEVDVLFLDIEMPGISGLELLDKLKYFPQVVFTTANREYAYEGYEYEITDFLSKPITLNRFNKTLQKITDAITNLNKSSTFSAEREIYIKQDGRLIRVPYEKIFYFESTGDYVKIETEMGSFVTYGVLKKIDERLTYPGFIKVHRSYVVNLSKIKDIEDNSLVIDNKVIPISRAHWAKILNTINIL